MDFNPLFYKSIILTICLLKTVFCKAQISHILVNEVEVNSIFFSELLNEHLEYPTINDTCNKIVIVIMPFVTTSTGVPDKIIDSLYKQNTFPHVQNNLAPYFFNLYSVCSFSAFCVSDSNRLYLFEFKGNEVLIWSPLNIVINSEVKRRKELIIASDRLEIPSHNDGTYFFVNDNIVFKVEQKIILQKYGHNLDWVVP
jgi:hypothetical protein